MPKYDALGKYLIASGQLEIKLSFLEIEKILGFRLPNSAYTYPAWWANGGHSQAETWVSVGFATEKLDILNETVLFRKKELDHHYDAFPESQVHNIPSVQENVIAVKLREQKPNLIKNDFISPPLIKSVSSKQDSNAMSVCGHEFYYIQQLIPERENGRVKEHFPQNAYNNRDNLPLLTNGTGAFCRFSIQAPAVSGVYLWVVDNEIIYIGETANLQKRFNAGYGNIAPRNCFAGGQSTNCKMNKVVMEYYRNRKPIALYFCQTGNYKQLEEELLRRVRTKYNVKRK